MATVTPNIGVGTASLASSLVTPGWPLASVPASNPIAGLPGSSPEPNTVDATNLTASLTQVGKQTSRVV